MSAGSRHELAVAFLGPHLAIMDATLPRVSVKRGRPFTSLPSKTL
jgi:hypothetical protein